VPIAASPGLFMTRRPRLDLARVVAVNLTILAVGVLVLELAFGNWFTPNRMNRLNIPRDAVSYVDVTPLYPSADRRVKYSRDHYGFRGTYASVDAIDILTIGGSTTDQRNIADGKTWQDVLAHEFLEHGAHVSVVNAGVDGQSAYGHIKNFEWWFPFIPRLKVRYFLFYVGLNDFYKDDGYVNDLLVKPSPAIKALLEENSALYQVYRTLFGMYQAVVVAKVSHRGIRFPTLEWTAMPNLPDHDGPTRHRLQAYRERLLALGVRAARLGGRVICVTQPSRAYKKVNGSIVGVARLGSYDGLPMNGVDYYHMIQRFHRTTLQTCREMGGLGIDLANEVEWDDEDFYDFSHSTPRGAEKIGRHLYAKLSAYESQRQASTPPAFSGDSR
jgi:hypothetical protein